MLSEMRRTTGWRRIRRSSTGRCERHLSCKYCQLTPSALLAKRLKELKAALAARSGDTPTARASPAVATAFGHLASSGSTLASDPALDRAGPLSGHRLAQLSIPTLDAVSGPSRTRVEIAQPSIAHPATEDEDDIPLRSPTRVQNIPSYRPRRMPTPPPEIDDDDIAMAEDFDQHDGGHCPQQEVPPAMDDELVPPSSPLPVTPSRPPARSRTLHPTSPTPQQPSARERRAAAIAAVKDLPADAIFSSPVQPFPITLPRTENSSTRTIGNGAEAGPSHVPSSQTRSAKPTTYKAGTQSSQAPKPVEASQASGAPGVQAPRTIVAEKRFPWSKEVDDKLRTYFKKPKFRFHQKEAIDETMAGKDGELAFRL